MAAVEPRARGRVPSSAPAKTATARRSSTSRARSYWMDGPSRVAEAGVPMTSYLIQASRGGKQLPTFLLDANVQGIVSEAHAARIGLDVIASGETTYLRESMFGSLEAIVGKATYHVHATKADEPVTSSTGWAPLTDDERAAMNNVATPEHERLRLYARNLRALADAYAKAADATGFAKRYPAAARYLMSEGARLTNESGHWFDRADSIEPVAVTA